MLHDYANAFTYDGWPLSSNFKLSLKKIKKRVPVIFFFSLNFKGQIAAVCGGILARATYIFEGTVWGSGAPLASWLEVWVWYLRQEGWLSF